MRRLVTMEDNAKTIINVAGDYVQSKHVDYEINNVEAGGIGIQFVNGNKTSTKPSVSKTTLRIKTPQLQTATFKYRYGDKYFTPITKLYQCLLNAKWIAADTKPDDFLAIFSGQESTARVKWIAKPAYLYYLIRKAVESELIYIPDGGKIWQITESHFTDSNRRPLHDLHKQKEPKTAIPAIETMLRILEPSA